MATFDYKNFLAVNDTEEQFNEVIMLDFNNDNSNSLNVTQNYMSSNVLATKNTVTVKIPSASLAYQNKNYFIKQSDFNSKASYNYFCNFTNAMKTTIDCESISYDELVFNLQQDLALLDTKRQNVRLVLGSIPVNNDDPEKIRKRANLFWKDVETQYVLNALGNLKDYLSHNPSFLSASTTTGGVTVTQSLITNLSAIFTAETPADIFVPYETFVAEESLFSSEKKKIITEFKNYEKRLLLNYIKQIQVFVVQNEKNISMEGKSMELANYYNYTYSYLLNSIKQVLFIKNTDTIYDSEKIKKGYKTVMTPLDLEPLHKILKHLFDAKAEGRESLDNKLDQALSLLDKDHAATKLITDTQEHPLGSLINKKIVIRINLLTKESGLDSIYFVLHFVTPDKTGADSVFIVNKIQQDLIRGQNVVSVFAGTKLDFERKTPSIKATINSKSANSSFSSTGNINNWLSTTPSYTPPNNSNVY